MAKIDTIDKERELISRTISGDKDAFGELYDFYAPKIFRFVRLKVKSRALAEDISSESFLRIWEYLQRENAEVEESFQALLYKIARNLIADFYKKKSSQEMLIDEDFEEYFKDQLSTEDSTSREEAEYIHKALINIKEEYQNVIIWYYVNDLSVAEIAKIINKTQGTTRVLIHRALKSLKKELQKLPK